MVHNGVIWNDATVAKEQEKEGIYYVSNQRDGRYNDSEVLMYDLADVFEGRKPKLDVEGSIAFIMVKLDKKGNRKSLLFGRNCGSPLKIMKYRNGFSLTSEGEGINIEPNKLFKYDYKTGKFSSTPLTIPYHNYYDSGQWEKYIDEDSYGRGYNGGYGYDDDYPTWKRSTETGVGYDSHGNRIDRNGYLIPDVSKSYVFTEKVLDRYKGMYGYSPSEDDSKTKAVKEVKNALLYDMNYATETAIEFAEYMYDEMEKRYNELEELIENDNENTTGNELDEYLELDVQMELLQKAIEELSGAQLQLALKSGLKKLTV